MHAYGVAALHMPHGTNRHKVQGTLAGVDKIVDGQGEQQGERQSKQKGELQGELCLLPLCYHYSNLCEFKCYSTARELVGPIRFQKVVT